MYLRREGEGGWVRKCGGFCPWGGNRGGGERPEKVRITLKGRNFVDGQVVYR